MCRLGGPHGREWGGPTSWLTGNGVSCAHTVTGSIKLGHRLYCSRRPRDAGRPGLSPGESHGRHFSMERDPWGGRTGGRHPRRGSKSVGVDITVTFPSCGVFTGTSLPIQWAAPSNRVITRVTWGPARPPSQRMILGSLHRFPNIRYLVDLHSYGETILDSRNPPKPVRRPADELPKPALRRTRTDQRPCLPRFSGGSLFCGENTGKFVEFGLGRRLTLVFTINHLRAAFPTIG